MPYNGSGKIFLKARVSYWICLTLVVMTLAAYRQVIGFDFVSFDDPVYVSENRYVRQGLTLEGLDWAAKVINRDYRTYWHPLTWLAHMLDYQLFGANAGLHHFSNLIFHIANTLLLFLIFRRMTGALWQSAILMVVAGNQVRYWKDSTTLYAHALEVTEGNFVIHNNLGVALKNRGRLDEAMAHYKQALLINPMHVPAHNNLGNLLEVQGNIGKAREQYGEALKIDPANPITYNNLGNITAKKGAWADAARLYQRALQLKPGYVEACYNLGNVFSAQGHIKEAFGCYRKALQLNSECVEAHINLANKLAGLGRYKEARLHYRRAVELDPENSAAAGNLKQLLASQARARLQNGKPWR